MNQTSTSPNPGLSTLVINSLKSITGRWTLFGVVFGATFPMAGTVIEMFYHNLPFQWASISRVQLEDPVLLIVDTAPLVLGFTFYLIGQREARFVEAHRNLQEAIQQARGLQNTLEQRVEERTRQLAQKSEFLRSAAFIVRSIAELQDVPTLLEKVVQLTSEFFGFYHVAIYLFDEERRIAFLQAASSDIGKKMMENGFHIESNSKNITGYISEQNKAYSISDDRESKGRLISEGKLEATRSELSIPLSVRGKITGVMDFQSKESHTFNQDEIETLQSLVDQIALSIDGVHLINDTQAFVNELESLTMQQTKDVWKRYLENRGIAYQYTPSGTKLINLRQNKSKPQGGIQVPLRLRGQEIGMLTLQGKEAARWSERERDVAEKVVSQLALALDNSRLLEETRQRAIQQQTVNEISARLSRSLDTDLLLQTAARELGALPNVSEASVFITVPEQESHRELDEHGGSS
jgi:GAF domain-containing protein